MEKILAAVSLALTSLDFQNGPPNELGQERIEVGATENELTPLLHALPDE
jgi:hypothetical protein